MAMLMLTSIMLGMGIPTTPAYIVVATLGAPALIKAGAPQLVAHMFVFYYAILSFITPPVCVAAFAGAAIAESNAMKMGLPPSSSASWPSSCPTCSSISPRSSLIGETPEIIWATITAIIGVIGIAGLQSWLLCSTSSAFRHRRADAHLSGSTELAWLPSPSSSRCRLWAPIAA